MKIIYQSTALGNDANPGTEESPLKTKKEVQERVSPGDTVVLMDKYEKLTVVFCACHKKINKW